MFPSENKKPVQLDAFGLEPLNQQNKVKSEKEVPFQALWNLA